MSFNDWKSVCFTSWQGITRGIASCGAGSFWIVPLIVSYFSGCQMAPKTTFSAYRPSQHSVVTESFVIKSDVPVDADDAIVRELNTLRQQVAATLQLPRQRDPVVVYLFSDETTYRYYMQTTWSHLPPRRAYFVGTPRELAVYSYRSPQMLEDLRHEFTHGVLHASLNSVPLWLDEGLAEYFEVGAADPGSPHTEHLAELTSAFNSGWGPNLFQLELISDFQKLTRRDYAESWAWVHFMMHSSPEAKQVLTDYIAELQQAGTPQRLLPRLERAVPDYYASTKAHVASVQVIVGTTGLQ